MITVKQGFRRFLGVVLQDFLAYLIVQTLFVIAVLVVKHPEFVWCYKALLVVASWVPPTLLLLIGFYWGWWPRYKKGLLSPYWRQRY